MNVVGEASTTLPQLSVPLDSARPHLGHTRWLVSPTYDLVWFLPVLFLIPILAGSSLLGQTPRLESLLASPAVVLFISILSIAHLSSPLITAWSLTGLRAEMVKNKRRYLLLPFLPWAIILPLAALAAGLVHDLPGLQVAHPWFWLVLGMTAIDIQHFSGQHFGFLSIYRRTSKAQTQAQAQAQASAKEAARDRQLDKLFAYTMSLLLVAAWIFRQKAPIGILAHYIPLPGTAPMLAIISGAVGVALSAARLALDVRSGIATLPRVLYISAFGAMVALSGLDVVDGLLLVTLWHWMGALGLSIQVMAAGQEQDPSPTTRWKKVTSSRLGSLLPMVTLLPLLVIVFGEKLPEMMWGAPGDLLLMGAAPTTLGYALMAGTMTSVRVTHILYDRLLYSFRVREIQEHVAPHIFGTHRGSRPS